jgi:hypothetical protein
MEKNRKYQIMTGAVLVMVISLATSFAQAQNICACEPDLYTCQDFSRADEAQECFSYCQKQTGADVHKFDLDGNGKACDSN